MTTEKRELFVDPMNSDITKAKTRKDIIDAQPMIVDIDGLDSKELEKKTREKVRMIELYKWINHEFYPAYTTDRVGVRITFCCDGVEVISPKIIDMVCLHFDALKDFFEVESDSTDSDVSLLPTVVWRCGSCVLQFAFKYSVQIRDSVTIWVRRYIDFDDKNSNVMAPVFWHMVARKSDDPLGFYCNQLYAPYGVCKSDSDIGYYLVKNGITKVGCVTGKQFVSSDLEKVIAELKKGTHYHSLIPYYGRESGQIILDYHDWQRCSVRPGNRYIIDHMGMLHAVPINLDLYLALMARRLLGCMGWERCLFTDFDPNTQDIYACLIATESTSFRVRYFNRAKVDYFNGCSMKDVFTGNFDFANADIILEGEKKNEVLR